MSFKSDKQRRAAMARLNAKKGNGTGEKVPSLALLRIIHSQRRPSAVVNDDRRAHQRTSSPDDAAAVKAWLRNPGRVDILGVDDPDAEYRATIKRRDAPLTGLAFGEELVVIRVKGSAKARPMTPARKKARAEGLAAVQRDMAALRKEQRGLKAKGKGITKPEATLLERITKRLTYLAQVESAYRDGVYLVMAKAKDKAIAEKQAAILRARFDLDARSMTSAVLFVGTTTNPSVYGYTHDWKPEEGVPGDFIAVNPKKFHGTAEADTMTHEAIHVMRKRESGRTQPETRGVRNYGEDRDIEEKYTVLEEQLRSAPPGTRKDDSYYASVYRNDPKAPINIGATDNRIARQARTAKKERKLTVIQEGMHRRGTRTYIARLHRDGTTGWGTIPPSLEGIDRVFTTQDGDAVHVYNPTGKPLRGIKDLVDGIDGRKGDRVSEYRDGKRRPLKGQRRRT
jgi:hypothetical protein